MPDWKNRIVGHGEEAPDQLLANPSNWRIHPKAQQEALEGVLDQVGWVQQILVNKRTGFVVDGHMRIAAALAAGVSAVPVVYVDLSEQEEALILATLDPIAAMAKTDTEKLDLLLQDVQTTSAAVQRMVADLAEKEKMFGDEDGSEVVFEPCFDVIVTCATEDDQRAFLDKMIAEGYACRALIA